MLVKSKGVNNIIAFNLKNIIESYQRIQKYLKQYLKIQKQD